MVVDGPTIFTVAERQHLRKTVSARSPVIHAGKRVGGRPSDALLRGMLRCGRCGVVMTANGQQYVCNTQRTGKICSPVGGLIGTMSIIDDVAGLKVLTRLAALDPGDTDDLDESVWLRCGRRLPMLMHEPTPWLSLTQQGTTRSA